MWPAACASHFFQGEFRRFPMWIGSFARRCGNALDAASLVSGVNLRGSAQKKEEEAVKLCKCLPALTFRQRIAGATICLLLGALLSLGSLASLAKLLLGNPVPFAFKCVSQGSIHLPGSVRRAHPFCQVIAC